jgi:hypothetical protein
MWHFPGQNDIKSAPNPRRYHHRYHRSCLCSHTTRFLIYFLMLYCYISAGDRPRSVGRHVFSPALTITALQLYKAHAELIFSVSFPVSGKLLSEGRALSPAASTIYYYYNPSCAWSGAISEAFIIKIYDYDTRSPCSSYANGTGAGTRHWWPTCPLAENMLGTGSMTSSIFATGQWHTLPHDVLTESPTTTTVAPLSLARTVRRVFLLSSFIFQI